MVPIIASTAAGAPDISSPMSKPSFMPSPSIASRSVVRVGSTTRSAPACLASSRRKGLRSVHHDEARADVPGDRGRHHPDRAGAGDQHVLAGEREAQRGVGGVAERVEDRAQVGVEVVGLDPHVGGGDHDVVGERAVAVDAHADRVDAQLPAAGAAVAAHAAHDVPLAGDPLADLHAGHVRRPPRRPRRRTRDRWSSASAPPTPPSRPSRGGGGRCRTVPLAAPGS